MTYPVPELVQATPDFTQVRQLWYARLLEHETGHKDLAFALAFAIDNNIETAIGSMPSRTDCDQLERQANILGEPFIEMRGVRHIAYDVETANGRTQGADL